MSTDTDNSLLKTLEGEISSRPSATKEAPSSHYSPGVTSSVEDRALHLLGAGVTSNQVASALGVTESRISQLLADTSFSARVSELRYKSLTEHNMRDSKYDKLEDRLLEKLEGAMPLLIKPESILKAMTVVNGAKRRGYTTTDQVTNNTNIASITLPTKIVNQFITNINNQVIKAGDQELLTMPSGNLMKMAEKAADSREVTYVQDSGGKI